MEPKISYSQVWGLPLTKVVIYQLYGQIKPELIFRISLAQVAKSVKVTIQHGPAQVQISADAYSTSHFALTLSKNKLPFLYLNNPDKNSPKVALTIRRA